MNPKIELVKGGRKVDGEFQSNESPVISTQTLQAQDPFEFPTIPPSTSIDGELGRLSEMPDTFTQSLQDRAQQTGKDEAFSFNNYLNAQLSAPTQSELESQAYSQKGGVDDIQKEVNALTADLRGEQRSLEIRLRALDKNPEGLFGGAVEDEKRRIQTESLQRQADISIIGMAAQDRFDSAKTIADRAINAIVEQNQKKIDAFGMLYERNSALFTEAEKRAFESAQADRERKLATEEADMRLLQSTKLEAMKMATANGAPSSVIASIQGATSPEDVLEVGGQWGSVDMLERSIKQEQLNSLRAKPEILAPTEVIDQGGRKILINSQTGEVIKDFGVSEGDTNELTQAVEAARIQSIDTLKSHAGFNSSVGSIGLGRIKIADTFTGADDDFIAGIDSLTKGLTLENLILAKERGATFGALSIPELKLLEDSATKINNWRIGEKNAEGVVTETTGYDASEKDFMAELDKISNFAKLDAILKGADPTTIGVVQTEDGAYWTKNGDGTLVKLR